MKKEKFSIVFLIAVLTTAFWVGCKNDDIHKAIPINPILQDVSLPKENEVMPGQDAIIEGKGFSMNDKLFLQKTDSAAFEVDVEDVTDNYIKFRLPKDAGGKYRVTVKREGKETTLDSLLVVPFVVVLENVALPDKNVERDSKITINGEGFEQGDSIELSADFYPAGRKIIVGATATDNGISFMIPDYCYGVNMVTVIRGVRQSSLGTIGIKVNIGDVIGGGIIFWTNSTFTHGLICSMKNVGTGQDFFGPGVDPSEAAKTSKDMGTGKVNTTNLIARIVAYRKNNKDEWENKKTAAELCTGLKVTTNLGGVYEDWFLPSQDELIELFKHKQDLANKGVTIPANNYWSSSVGDGIDAGWAAYYVNFYESTTVISGEVPKNVWKIAVRPVRSF